MEVLRYFRETNYREKDLVNNYKKKTKKKTRKDQKQQKRPWAGITLHKIAIKTLEQHIAWTRTWQSVKYFEHLHIILKWL